VVESSREWWESAKSSYGDNVTTRRQREFFELVDSEYLQIARVPESAIIAPATEAAPEQATPTAG
jgi:hypothetical protein